MNHIDKQVLIQAIARFPRANILVLGDVMLDEFIWGRVSRISPEAPVPVVDVESETMMLGGAANVLHNIIALGGKAGLCGLVGDDGPGRAVKDLLADLGVDSSGILVSDLRPTTVKTRVVAHGQQMVRVDRERRGRSNPQEIVRLQAYLEREVARCDAVIVSDYAKGVVTPELMGKLMSLAHREGKIVAVDPKVINMKLFSGATVVTPNDLEAINFANTDPDLPDAVSRAGRKLLADLDPEFILVTQGEKGMTVFTPGEEQYIPTSAQKVFDVTGAGDTVISTLSLGLATGLKPNEAAMLSNIAAGVVVGEVGTSAVTAGRLRQVLETLPHPWAR